MGADTADDLSLPLAQLSRDTQMAVAEKLPGFATSSNPIDITAALLSNSGLFGDVLPVVAKDPAADLFFIDIPVAGAGYDVEAFARDAAAFENDAGKPVAVAAWQDSVAAPFRAHGIATFQNEADAIGVLAQLADHTAMLRRPRVIWSELPRVELLPSTEGVLNEADSLALVGRYGVPTVESRLCVSVEEAVNAFESIGAPVVVKACSAQVPHKSEHGLVALRVGQAEEVRELFNQFASRMAAMGVQGDGVIVAAMSRGRHELMVGARVDPVFGPVVVVGDGGKYVEALKDVAVLLPPFSVDEVVEALRTLRIAPLLEGVRGDPPLDVRAVGDIAVAVGKLIAGAGGRIASIDLNPVLVNAQGEGALVVDALVECGVSKPKVTASNEL